MGEMFALTISEGAISNVLARAREPLAGCGNGDPRDGDGKPGGLLRRDLGTGDGEDLVGVGVCRHPGGVARQFAPARGKTVVQALFRNHSANGLGLRYAGQSARPWSGMAGVPGRICCAMRATPSTSAAMSPAQRGVQTPSAARDRHPSGGDATP